MLRRDDHVAAEQQLEAAGDGGAVGRADEWHSDTTLEEPMERVRDVVVAESEGVAGRERAQVHAGTERAIAGAGEHEGAYIGIAFRVDDGSADRPDEFGRQRVACLRTVEPAR